MFDPPNCRGSYAPGGPYFHSQIYFDSARKGAKLAATALQKLLQPSDVKALPRRSGLRAFNPGATLVVVVGQTFHNTLTVARTISVPARQPAAAQPALDWLVRNRIESVALQALATRLKEVR